ncbi:MAG: GGDEF domain-containing protein, partial [Rhodospirillales bacterium]
MELRKSDSARIEANELSRPGLVARVMQLVEAADRGLGHETAALDALDAAQAAEAHLAEVTRRLAHLEKLAMTDELTTLLNRRGFQEELMRVLSNASRYGEHGILVYVDLDGFKPINDTYGHLAGDDVLKRVAQLLRENVRSTDYVARLGGDEFAVLLTRTDWDNGLMRAELLETLLNNAYTGWEGRMIPIRASFGIQAYHPGD